MPEFKFEDARVEEVRNSVTGERGYALMNSVQSDAVGEALPAPVAPEFTRFEAGGRAIMILNGMRLSNYTGKTVFEQSDNKVQDFKMP